MKKIAFLALLCVLYSHYKNGSTPLRAEEEEKVVKAASFSFVSNQCKGNVWYKPGGTIINGHIDESFGNRALWSQLMNHLKRTGGSFSVYAAEIGYMSSTNGLLSILKEEGIPFSVEMPGFTQCIPGTLLGEAEINGKPVNGVNIFSTIFRITSEDRTGPDGHGWFVTKDRMPVIPDEILFDERQPNLLPEFDAHLLATTQGTWEERKATAKKNNGCAVSMGDYRTLLATLRQDYVDFLQVAKTKWGDKMPAIGIHWNVVAGWEWRDQKGLDDIYAKDPAYFNTAENFYAIVQKCPQYNSVQYLNDLIDVLTSAGFKPQTVYMDVDWTYDIPYITEVLKRHKEALKAKDVQMGINIVEASLQDNEELYFDGTTLVRRTLSSGKPNELYENTLIAIVQFLKASGIYDKNMQMRVGSWSHRPYETGSQVDEKITGSMAHAANEIVKLLSL